MSEKTEQQATVIKSSHTGSSVELVVLYYERGKQEPSGYVSLGIEPNKRPAIEAELSPIKKELTLLGLDLIRQGIMLMGEREKISGFLSERKINEQ